MRKTSKKLIAFLILFAISFTLVSCSEKDKTSNSVENTLTSSVTIKTI